MQGMPGANQSLELSPFELCLDNLIFIQVDMIVK